ncbi:hypothetical protein NWF32_23715 [Pseudomonas qingdaonensis]|nr:hypothetical protein [Pseudomonas qingdaonensis]
MNPTTTAGASSSARGLAMGGGLLLGTSLLSGCGPDDAPPPPPGLPSRGTAGACAWASWTAARPATSTPTSPSAAA